MTITEPNAIAADEQQVRDAVAKLLADNPPVAKPTEADIRSFLGAQFDAGLAWVHFAEGYGGLGLRPKLQEIINEEIRSAGGPHPYMRNPIGYGMGAPTVYTHGSEDQKKRYLRPLFTGEEVWCQLFSEPGAGSDVAGLSSRAMRDGDEWIVNGQKVWTTLAHVARWGMLITRTDPDKPKHKGMTYFVVDMQAPGVEVKPLRQMTGDAEFNEVYFTDVRIPDAERLGDIGEGWGVSLTTLMNERVSIGGTVAPRGSGPIASAVELYKKRKANGGDDPVRLERLMKLWVSAEVARLTNMRSAGARKVGNPGPEGSVGKLASAEFNKAVYEFITELQGMDGQLYGSYDQVRGETAGYSGDLRQAFLRSRANSIEGGTTEVMKNILGERVLGLPGDVRVDKDRPWIEIPRS